MNKQAFLDALRSKLSGLPKEDVEERLSFYSEMIDDRTEEGCTEEEAVLAVGSVEEIAAQIISEHSFAKVAKEKRTFKRKFKAWEIALLAFGLPIGGVLLIAALAVVFSLYVSVWAILVSLWASFGAVAGGALGGVAGGAFVAVCGSLPSGLVLLAAGLVCAGLSIFLFLGCRAATKGLFWLTKQAVRAVKHCFKKKEAVI